ncbi:YadA-like family protein [Streptobacillus felis]|uniref:YadA-like family protein n=1 Tax=Streptobacillus felis TaxID=1384509 RepID=A0A7Z0PEB4_9FUSO|nr:YadA-like family protein [Streptobacillus felis]NYV27612.1 YadA-like family protein [Streptobacillus felis]
MNLELTKRKVKTFLKGKVNLTTKAIILMLLGAYGFGADATFDNLKVNKKIVVYGGDYYDGGVVIRDTNGKGSIYIAGENSQANLKVEKGAPTLFVPTVTFSGFDPSKATRITYATYKDYQSGMTETIATLNDGLIFKGNNDLYENRHMLNSTVNLVGERDDNVTHYTAYDSAKNNIFVAADDHETMTIKLAKNLVNIESISNEADKAKIEFSDDVKVTGGNLNLSDNKITNVADGEISGISKDAVNGSQLYAISKQVEDSISNVYVHVNTGEAIQEDGNELTNQGKIGAKGGAREKGASTLGLGAKAQGINSTALGSYANSKAEDAVAIGNGAVAKNQRAIAIGRDAETGALDTSDMRNNVGAIAIGSSAKAINEGTIAIGTQAVAGTPDPSKTNVKFAIAIGENSSAKSLTGIALGYRTKSDKDFATSIGYGADSRVETGIALGALSIADRKDGVKGYNVAEVDKRENKYAGLKGSALTSRLSALSIGNKGQSRQIINVAAGTEDTDAVNVAQLRSINLKFAGDEGKNDVLLDNQTLNIKGDGKYIKTTASSEGIKIEFTEEIKDKLDNQGNAIKDVKTDASSGVASAVAMANLPQVSNIAGHRHNIAGSYGYYNGEHAFALGLSGLNESGNVVYRASGAINTKGYFSIGAGLGYQFDNLESRRKDMLTLQRHGNINLLDEKVYELEMEVSELREKISNLEKTNKLILEKLEKIEKR